MRNPGSSPLVVALGPVSPEALIANLLLVCCAVTALLLVVGGGTFAPRPQGRSANESQINPRRVLIDHA